MTVLAVPTALLTAAAVVGVLPPASPGVERVLTDPRIRESSGLVASAQHPGILWTANDGGQGRLFAVGADGRTRATYRLAGVQARDWEALAPGRDESGRPVLYVGDIGDNNARRSNGLLVHAVVEPGRLADGELRATSYRLRYPDGPHDAEALLVDPRTGRVFVVTKSPFGGAVYAAPPRLSASGPNALTRVGDAPGLVTDGAFLPDGRVVLRGYGTAHLAAGLSGSSLEGDEASEFVLPEQPQGESLAALPEGGSVLVGSEGVRSEVWRATLPATPAAAAPAFTGSVESGAGSGGGSSGALGGSGNGLGSGSGSGAAGGGPPLSQADVPSWLRLLAAGAVAASMLVTITLQVRRLRRRREGRDGRG